MNKGGNAEGFRTGCVNGGKGIFTSGRWDDGPVIVAVSVLQCLLWARTSFSGLVLCPSEIWPYFALKSVGYMTFT